MITHQSNFTLLDNFTSEALLLSINLGFGQLLIGYAVLWCIAKLSVRFQLLALLRRSTPKQRTNSRRKSNSRHKNDSRQGGNEGNYHQKGGQNKSNNHSGFLAILSSGLFKDLNALFFLVGVFIFIIPNFNGCTNFALNSTPSTSESLNNNSKFKDNNSSSSKESNTKTERKKSKDKETVEVLKSSVTTTGVSPKNSKINNASEQFESIELVEADVEVEEPTINVKGYGVQVAAYKNESEARSQMHKFSQQYTTVFLVWNDKGIYPPYQVVIGAYKDRFEAKKLEDKEFPERPIINLSKVEILKMEQA